MEDWARGRVRNFKVDVNAMKVEMWMSPLSCGDPGRKQVPFGFAQGRLSPPLRARSE